MRKDLFIRNTVLGAFLAMSASSCTTLGTNVRGNFSCRAPEGTCAPSMVIDDRALSSIVDEGGGYSPAIHYENDDVRLENRRTAPMQVAYRPQAQSSVAPQFSNVGASGSDRILRITFPGHTDGNGIYHEARSVRVAVAANVPVRVMPDPSQMNEMMPPVQVTDASRNASAHMSVIGSGVVVTPTDTSVRGYPSPEAVAAARARARPPSARAGSESPSASSPVNQPERFSPLP